MDDLERKQKREHGSSFWHKARRVGSGVATTLSMLMLAATASAEVVATGDLQSVVRDGALNGTNITWDNQLYQPQFFPWSVNLGAEPGINVMEVPPPPYFYGQAFAPMGGFIDDFEARFGNFFIQFYSDQGNPVFPPPVWNGVLSVSTDGQLGEYICEAVDPNAPFPLNAPYIGPNSCSKGSTDLPVDVTFVNAELSLAGSFVDNGSGTLPTELGDESTITYSIDGGGTCFEHFLELEPSTAPAESISMPLGALGHPLEARQAIPTPRYPSMSRRLSALLGAGLQFRWSVRSPTTRCSPMASQLWSPRPRGGDHPL